MTQSPLQRLGIGGVDLQWEIGHALHGLDGRIKDSRFIKPRHADVDVQNMRTRFCLRNGFAQHVCHIAFRQRHLEFLLSGRVYALADDDGIVEGNRHGARSGGDDG